MLLFTWHWWRHSEVRDVATCYPPWRERRRARNIYYSAMEPEKPEQLFFLPLTRTPSESSFWYGICNWKGTPIGRTVKQTLLVDPTVFLEWFLENVIERYGFRAALGMRPPKIFRSNHHYGEFKWWLKCRSRKNKVQGPFQMPGPHSRSQSSSSQMATHALSRVWTDAKASIMSFRTFPCQGH